MSQKKLEESVARMTGEDRRTITRRGFSMLNLGPVELEDEDFHEPLVVDWDQLDRERGFNQFLPQ
jgi:hypothetical protein